MTASICKYVLDKLRIQHTPGHWNVNCNGFFHIVEGRAGKSGCSSWLSLKLSTMCSYFETIFALAM